MTKKWMLRFLHGEKLKTALYTTELQLINVLTYTTIIVIIDILLEPFILYKHIRWRLQSIHFLSLRPSTSDKGYNIIHLLPLPIQLTKSELYFTAPVINCEDIMGIKQNNLCLTGIIPGVL